jgi:hypothetical protein
MSVGAMPHKRDLRSVIEAADQAAAAGDYTAAEEALREAVVRQEASLGLFHPDLANTLNNLGVVCEIVDKPVDAELCFRRAYAIATAALEPNHPFVATSEKNLRDFCSARGKPFELPQEPPVAAPASAPVVAPDKPSRTRVIGVLVVSALVLGVTLATRLLFSSNGNVESSQMGVAPPPFESSAPITTSSPAEPTAGPRTESAGDPPVGTHESRRVVPVVSEQSTVVDASLCRDLSTGEWQCHPAGNPVDSGTLFFYTRIKSSTNTTVQHRWYRGNRLHQVVDLRIQANQGTGYRTYSRTTVSGTNDWRVELRTDDGALLHEQRFVVR